MNDGSYIAAIKDNVDTLGNRVFLEIGQKINGEVC